MIEEILTRAGIPFRRSRFLSPPASDYAVYTDDVTADGPDLVNRVYQHDASVEVYTTAPNDALEASIESELDAAGLRYTKQDRYWLQDVQRYQIVYEFTFYEKRRA